jgi:hypothetical protein
MRYKTLAKIPALVPPELYATPSLGFEVDTLFAEDAILQVI